jgi:hypothetical protein
MAQSTWSAKSTAWSGDTYSWANNTYQHTALLTTNVDAFFAKVSWDAETTTWATDTNRWGYIVPIARQGIITLGANVDTTITGGFAFVGSAVMGLGAGLSSANNTIYPTSVTLAVNDGLTSIGNKLYVDSITMGTTVNIPLPGTTTWDLDASTWSGTSGSWGYTPTKIMPVTAAMTQTIFSELNEEDTVFPRSLEFSSDYGMAGTVALVVPVAGTLSNEQNIKNNINFEESATLGAIADTSSINSFLWNDEAEDTGTTWTKVSDPDE